MNRWVLGGLAGLVMLGFVYFKGVQQGQKDIQKKWDAEKVVLEREAQQLKDQAREAERSMQKEVNRIQREKHDLSTALSLTACATVQKPVPPMQCPAVPEMLLDAPERSWLDQMQNFLRGMLPTQNDSKPRTTPAEMRTK
jgi:hypothetical protein